MTVYSISHININVADLDASLAFYVDRLGLNLVRRVRSEEPAGVDADPDQPRAHETGIVNTGERGVSLENIDYGLQANASPAPELGIKQLRLEIMGSDLGGQTVTDPDGISVEVVPAERNRIAGARIHVADLDATKAHWHEALGFDFHDAPAGSDYDAFLEVRSSTDQFRCEFVEVGGEVALTTGAQLGARRLAFTVDDVQACYDRAIAAGGRSLDAPAQFELGPVRMVAGLWFDPNGIVLQGLQYIKNEAS
ncbi:MAG: VOC family protein [Candidatus Nanopelagicales bacterium]